MITHRLPWQDYCQIKKMNPSTAVAGCHSMKRLRRWIAEGFKEETNAMRVGTGVHVLLLEPERFENEFVVLPDFHLDEQNLRKPKRKDEPESDRRTDSKVTEYYKSKIRAFAEENQGKSFLTRDQYDNCLHAIEAIRERPAMRELIDGSAKEVTVEGEILGVPFKGRMDLLNPSVITDVKNTANVDKRAFGRVFTNLHYAFKLSIYRDLMRQNRGDNDVMIITQETQGDFDNALVPVPSIILDNAFEQVQRVVKQYKQCLESGVWPGVDQGKDEYELYIPQWAMEDSEDLDFGGLEFEVTF